METINQQKTLEYNNQLLVIAHLSQFLTYITGFGGLVVLLILWLTTKDSVAGMDEHGKAIVNFQLTVLLVTIVSVPAILLLGLGILSLIFIGIVAFIIPIVNAVRASNGEKPNTFMTIPFVS